MNDMNMAMKTTQALLGFIESSLKIRLHAEGVEHIPTDRPVLYVINHFTRLETFLIPRVIYQQTGRAVRSLGDASLFGGAFGKYLRACGVMPTNEPGRNRIIVGDLMSGHSDWVIYPEGSMVKSKKVYDDGEWMLDLPHFDQPRSPHTGSAVLALKAAIHRLQYKDAEARKHDTLLSSLHERYKIEAGFHVSEKSPIIIPVNISYYPIRPGKNAISMIAEALTNGLPRKVREELAVEGALLCETTDVSVYFGEAIDVESYVQPWYDMSKTLLPFVPEQKRINMLIASQKGRLMKRFMSDVYENVAVNFDHIYCMALRRCRSTNCSEDDFLTACYCAAMRIRAFDHRRIHPTLRENLIHIITDKDYEPLQSIRDCALEEELICIEEGRYTIDRSLQHDDHDFHEIRLKHPVGVIANEIEPLRKVVEVIDNTVNQPAAFLNKKVAKMVMNLDLEDFEHDFAAYYDIDQSKSQELGKPFFLEGSNKDLGIVLCHGYLAAPAEIRELAQYLNNQGYSVYAVRLRGHGTAPCNLANVSWNDWLVSYLRGVAVISQLCKRVVFGGFSMGGLLSLLAAARMPCKPAGVFTINTPLKLRDTKSKLVPAIAWWNRIMENFASMRMDYVENDSENPELNYSLNYINGVNELGRLIDQVEEQLPKIQAPCLILQGNKDPTVDPSSASMIQEGIGSKEVLVEQLRFNRHIIIKGPDSESVFKRIEDFIENL